MIGYVGMFCFRAQTLQKAKIGAWIRGILSRKESFWFMGFTTCLSLLVEEKVSGWAWGMLESEADRFRNDGQSWVSSNLCRADIM